MLNIFRCSKFAGPPAIGDLACHMLYFAVFDIYSNFLDVVLQVTVRAWFIPKRPKRVLKCRNVFRVAFCQRPVGTLPLWPPPSIVASCCPSYTIVYAGARAGNAKAFELIKKTEYVIGSRGGSQWIRPNRPTSRLISLSPRRPLPEAVAYPPTHPGP